jgi:DNA-binding winged helix-turn-helix (wHTH) protein/TolB-like protein/Tfp pilus assembly protein PilF
MSQIQPRSFDGWVLRADIGELTKDGRKTRLQDQPLQILDALLSQPGELVTREHLIARLWPKGVVDFDTGLNSAVRKLRVALCDEADTPRYIETVPRKGYRFIGSLDPPIAAPGPPAEVAISAPGGTSPPPAAAAPRGRRSGEASEARFRRPLIYAALGAAAVLIAVAIVFALRREPVPALTQPASQIQRIPLGARTLAILPLRTSGTDETSILLAQSLADLIRNRFAAFPGLVVIASSSTHDLTYLPSGMRAIGEKLDAQFLLTGGAERVGERLRMDLQLVDANSGKQLWSTSFDRPLAEVAQMREEIFQQVADVLHLAAGQEARSVSPRAAISLDAYQLYMRGQKLLANERMSDCESAIELFQRATILDPAFARAYLGLGQGHLLAFNLNGGHDADQQLLAERALDRALDLNPALGEAWVARARSTRNPAKAETLYRKGLDLAPNYGAGYASFADFLFSEGRTGEAINMVDRARTIDPLTPALHLRQAFFLIVTRSDVVAHDRLVREALAINPGFQPALQQLAQSRWEYSGDFAGAARIIERAIALDPESGYSRSLATHIYLDLGEPNAATAVRGDDQRLAEAIDVAQYQRDPGRAADLARALPTDAPRTGGSFATEAEAIRDGAILTGEYGPALAALESSFATSPRAPRMWGRSFAIVYAHTLVLAGQAERGRRLAASTLMLLDSHSIGRTENWFARERAAAYMVLGEHERALDELTAAVKLNRVYRWWYTFELDPLFEPLRHDPRFIALNEQVKKHRDEQHALVEDMRRKGQVPSRGH